MEDIVKEGHEIETLNPSIRQGSPPFTFPHRRSHLKSKTCNTLHRIFSICKDKTRSSLTLPIVSDSPNPDDSIKPQEAQNEKFSIEKELVANKSAEKVISTKPSALPAEEDTISNNIDQLGLPGAGIVVEESGKEDENVEINEKSLNLENNEEIRPISDTQERNSSLEQDVVEEVVEEMPQRVTNLTESVNSGTPMDSCLGLITDKETEITEEMQQKELGVSEPVNTDTQMDYSVGLIIDKEIEVAEKMEQTETELVKQFDLDTLMESSFGLMEDKEIEDGEISDDIDFDIPYDLFDESVVLTDEMKVGEEQFPGESIGQREIDEASKVDKVADEKNASPTRIQEEVEERKNEKKVDKDDKMGYSGTGNIEQAYASRMLEAMRNAKENGKAKRAIDYELIYPDNPGDSKKNKTGNEGKSPTMKEGKVGKKRTLTKERKEKKKHNERKKRAQKNRELGVKRLKIETITKPKVVKYCEFYLNGRCQKGDSCKFSHDTTPLTKSQPCKFLALQSCLKGDNCPFDHQLSRYPCNNFVSKGYCVRGDKCLFSHKIVEGPTTSNTTPTEIASQSQPGHSNTKNTPSSTIKDSASKETTPSSAGMSIHRHPVLERLKKPAQTPKGITFLSFGNGSSNQKDINGVEISTQKNQNSSEKLPNSNDLLWSSTPTTSTPASQSSKLMSNDQNKNSAQRALTSTLAFAAKYESDMVKGKSKCSPEDSTKEKKVSNLGKNTSSSGANDVQNGWMKASPLLQEFLFGVGSDGK